MPGLKKTILRYADYGNKTYDSLFSPEIRSRALKYEANYLQTSVLWNNNGRFDLQALPAAAQLSPVFGIAADDLDGDGKTDIWLGGNFYALKPQAGRYNASKGVLLKGLGNQAFAAIPAKASGISVEGEVRDAGIIHSKQSKYLIVGRNNKSVLLFEKKK